MYALLAAAVMIDGEEDERERLEFDALVARSRTLSQITPEELNDIEAEIRPRLAKNRISDLIIQACASLKDEEPEVGLSVFAHLCDIVNADGVVQDTELTFLEDVAGYLALVDEDKDNIARAIHLKNKH